MRALTKKGALKMATRKKPKPKPPKPKPEPKYSWILDPKGVTCFADPKGGQTIMRLWEAEELTGFHDAELAKATREINSILSRIDKNNKDPERKLSFIEFQNRHLLVWSRYDVVSPYDDEATIVKALRLKVK
jgi:hypothetical protein